jgi:hypothetical protein
LKVQSEIGLAAALFLLIPSLAAAQHAQHIAAAPAPAHVRVASPGPVATRAGAHSSNSRAGRISNQRDAEDLLGLNGGTPLSIQELLNPFPGFGFNFEHLSAINQDLGIKALIDPATQARLAVAERLLRETRFSPGFFLIDGGGSYVVPVGADQQPQAQQPIIIVQQPAPQEAATRDMNEPPPAEAAAPVTDEGEFTLVLRDGKLLQAAAFTRMNDKIVYITPDGGRRSVAVGDLDSNATLRINQERGTPLQLPL